MKGEGRRRQKSEEGGRTQKKGRRVKEEEEGRVKELPRVWEN